ncbi:C13 family peptidase [Caulobacter sp.]|uniref:C13 family peptidase n=1 Tax=Caulobacter sp. TaxID=78 RepID=UPI002B46AD1D|nr:C13 family peptidase [Caulobacter sp.]HJV43797.1 C13 family peptidase [Caulobacter sp.]
MRFAAIIGVLVLLVSPPASARAAGPFADWAAVVVAGDFHSHSGGTTEAFDNARRDVSRTLVGLGFERSAIAQFSVRPDRYPSESPGRSDTQAISEALRIKTASAKAGCLFYISSHGSPDGAVLGKTILRPQLLAAMLDQACPNRPSIVVVSACFSGVFIPPLQKSDRLVLTAARSDRASFGCGESDKYPYFDDCFLSAAPTARDFTALGAGAQACVARREKETGAEPPSEPQVWIGAALRPMLPLYAFDRSRPRAP